MKKLKVSISFLCFSYFFLFPVLAEGPGTITQAEWAVYLARGLGLEKNLPPETTTDRYIAILGSKGYRRVEGEDYQKASPDMVVQTTTTYGLPSQKKWMEARKDGWLKYRFETPVTRSYTLRARVRGDIQFWSIWSIDKKGSVLVTPKDELEWIEVGEFNLEAGEHEILVSVPPGGGVDVFELVTGNAPSIEPQGGFQPLAPLTNGDIAVTLIKALNLEDRLPIDEGFYLIIEAEHFDRAEGKFQIREDQKPGRASEKKWVKAEGELRSQYSFEVPEKGMYSIYARGFGDTKESWTIDQGVEKVTLKPNLPDKFSWLPVTTVFLETGPHTIDVELRAGNGSDVIMMTRRRSDQGNYLQLLSDLGLREGALPGKEIEEKRRYEPCLEVEAEDYQEAAGKVRKSTEDRYGGPSDQEWVEPLEKEAACRYEVELKEDGMYALHARSFGPYVITWTIDPQKKRFREQRRLFPWSEDGFLWQEVVTLELPRGKHIFKVNLPQADGLDVFELRKRSWSTADLNSLAQEEVSRAEALRNLKEVEKIPPKPIEPEDPEPNPGPEPNPYYNPLSTYVPGR